MSDWRRRADPAFYDKEPFVLRTVAQVPRYSEDAQAEARLDVLSRDGTLTVITFVIALSTCAAAIGVEPLVSPLDWVRAAAFVVLAIAAPFALPWRRHALKRECLAIAALAAIVLLVLALVVAPMPTAIAALALAFAGREVTRASRAHAQVFTWSAYATVLTTCAYAFSFSRSVGVLHLVLEIVAVAVAYLGVCVLAFRIRRAELIARPEGVLSLPQSVVPLLDRSHHHAVIAWLA